MRSRELGVQTRPSQENGRSVGIGRAGASSREERRRCCPRSVGHRNTDGCSCTRFCVPSRIRWLWLMPGRGSLLVAFGWRCRSCSRCCSRRGGIRRSCSRCCSSDPGRHRVTRRTGDRCLKLRMRLGHGLAIERLENALMAGATAHLSHIALGSQSVLGEGLGQRHHVVDIELPGHADAVPCSRPLRGRDLQRLERLRVVAVGAVPVPYTHLTLPTILPGADSLGAVEYQQHNN